MDHQPVVGGHRREALRRIDVVDALRDVDVHADAVRHCQRRSRLERFVTARERGMDADHAAGHAAGPPVLRALAQVPVVLLEPAAGTVGAVTVGDAVTRRHPHADLGARVGDHRQGSLDGVRRLVMVDDRGASRFEGFERAELRRPFEHLQVECPIEAPPHQLEHRRGIPAGCGAARACRAPAPSRDDDARTPVRGCHPADRTSAAPIDQRG